MDQEAVASLAGFAAYVVACSPTAMRLNSGPLKAQLEAAAAILDKQGAIPKAPEILGEKSITELLADGTVKFTVDPKYPQAIGIANILHHASVFGNSSWEILHNGEEDSPFFTSDYPAAIETFGVNAPINRIVPFAPDIAVRIRPDMRLSGAKPDITFSKFSGTTRHLKRSEVLEINRMLVRCAEDTIFFRDDRDWIPSFVEKNRRYRIETVTHKFTHGSRQIEVSTHRIAAQPAATVGRAHL
jgi:hypothetical protein